MNRTFANVLRAKGFAEDDVQFADFLQCHGQYDRIVANPPFNYPTTGSDMTHVMHMYDCLAPGGRLASIMGEHAFFADTSQAVDFRAWLDAVGGESEKLPDDSFQGVNAFRETGVMTRLVVIQKERK